MKNKILTVPTLLAIAATYLTHKEEIDNLVKKAIKWYSTKGR